MTRISRMLESCLIRDRIEWLTRRLRYAVARDDTVTASAVSDEILYLTGFLEKNDDDNTTGKADA